MWGVHECSIHTSKVTYMFGDGAVGEGHSSSCCYHVKTWVTGSVQSSRDKCQRISIL